LEGGKRSEKSNDRTKTLGIKKKKKKKGVESGIGKAKRKAGRCIDKGKSTECKIMMGKKKGRNGTSRCPDKGKRKGR